MHTDVAVKVKVNVCVSVRAVMVSLRAIAFGFYIWKFFLINVNHLLI